MATRLTYEEIEHLDRLAAEQEVNRSEMLRLLVTESPKWKS